MDYKIGKLLEKNLNIDIITIIDSYLVRNVLSYQMDTVDNELSTIITKLIEKSTVTSRLIEDTRFFQRYHRTGDNCIECPSCSDAYTEDTEVMIRENIKRDTTEIFGFTDEELEEDYIKRVNKRMENFKMNYFKTKKWLDINFPNKNIIHDDERYNDNVEEMQFWRQKYKFWNGENSMNSEFSGITENSL